MIQKNIKVIRITNPIFTKLLFLMIFASLEVLLKFDLKILKRPRHIKIDWTYHT